MVQRLHLTVEVDEKADGTYEAHCPELLLTAKGRFADEAVDRLKELVFSSVSSGFDSAFSPPSPSPDLLKTILAAHRNCYLHLPPPHSAH
jgi:hypothetical protein